MAFSAKSETNSTGRSHALACTPHNAVAASQCGTFNRKALLVFFNIFESETMNMTASSSSTATSAPAPHMLLVIQKYIRTYLVCTDYEMILLSLWIVHTWCYRAFRVTPYLNIQSPVQSSGKTRLLQILQALCPSDSWLLSAPSQRILMDKLLSLKPNPASPKGQPVQDLPSVLLLDDRDATLGASSRNALVSLLKIGAYSELRYFSPVKSHFLREFTVYCPKAFAGTSPLPRSLSDLSIPIRLKRNKPSETVARFIPASAAEEARPIVNWLDSWSRQNFGDLARSAELVPAELPPQLDGHRLEGAIPLIEHC